MDVQGSRSRICFDLPFDGFGAGLNVRGILLAICSEE